MLHNRKKKRTIHNCSPLFTDNSNVNTLLLACIETLKLLCLIISVRSNQLITAQTEISAWIRSNCAILYSFVVRSWQFVLHLLEDQFELHLHLSVCGFVCLWRSLSVFNTQELALIKKESTSFCILKNERYVLAMARKNSQRTKNMDSSTRTQSRHETHCA
jgi:hypothetical protein